MLTVDRTCHSDRLRDIVEAIVSANLAGHDRPKVDGAFQVLAFRRLAETPVQMILGVRFFGDPARGDNPVGEPKAPTINLPKVVMKL